MCAAALALIDEEGLPALNMRSLAEMGVDAMALYRHPHKKQAILDGVVDLVLTDLSDDSTGDVRERVYRFFASLRDVLAAHPNAIPLVVNSALQTATAKERAARLLAVMRGSGLNADQALDAFHTLESFTLGYAWLEVAGFVGELPENAPFVRSNVRRGAASAASGGATAASSDTASRLDRYDRCLRAVLEHFCPRDTGRRHFVLAQHPLCSGGDACRPAVALRRRVVSLLLLSRLTMQSLRIRIPRFLSMPEGIPPCRCLRRCFR